MSRYRITSPLHALIALKQGFKLLDVGGVKIGHSYVIAALEDAAFASGGFHIAPESEHLREPKIGDLIDRGLGEYQIVDDIDGSRAWFADGDGYTYGDLRIILRDGKPFPKIERAE